MGVNRIFVLGTGAVSPAGWGATPLREAVKRGSRLPDQQLFCPGQPQPLKVLRVPAQSSRPAFMAHPRLRRTSAIGQYAVAAALEAIGQDLTALNEGTARLGIVYCAMAGCVNFSRRFYDETLKDPGTASPVIFPETVFNAPASHLGALLKSTAINYTLVGDPGTFLQGLALGADWLVSRRVDRCLVIGAEELDWLVAQALNLFGPQAFVGEGAGAVYLGTSRPGPISVELSSITNSHLFNDHATRGRAARKARDEAGAHTNKTLLCDGTQANPRLDRDEEMAWSDWSGTRLSPKRVCGEAFVAAAAWQCVMAITELTNGAHDAAQVSVVGCNQQAIAATFTKGDSIQ